MFIIKDREATDWEMISCVSSHLGGGKKQWNQMEKENYFISLLDKAEAVNVTLNNSPYTVGLYTQNRFSFSSVCNTSF